MIATCLTIGVTSFTYNSKADPVTERFKFNHDTLMPDYSIQRIDLERLSDRSKWVDAVNDDKPDNTGYQLIRWEQQHYHNRF